MIAASILFKLPLTTDWKNLRQIAKDRAKKLYLNVPGLKIKVFVLNQETGEYRGFYVWENKKSLDKFLNSSTFENSKEKFGVPEIKIFDLLVYIKQGRLHSIK